MLLCEYTIVFYLSSRVMYCMCNVAANTEPAQPATDNSTQQNPPPAEPTNVPQVPENVAGSSYLQPQQVAHQQELTESHAPPVSAVCIV